ncbi:unnamed protein product, partial [Prorocentrum cordatum]
MFGGSFVRGALQLACVSAACGCKPEMGNAEAVEVIKELGLSFSPAWSMDELRHTIKEALFPRDESASQKILKGISAMKKQELAQKAEEVGAHLTPNMTKTAMKLEIRKAVLMKTKPAPTDFMDFGKHGVSSWNGRKLGTDQGNQKGRETRDKAEPEHLWISTWCGPLSTLTLGFNATNPARAEMTRQRRVQAIKEYKGAVQLVYDQVAQGRRAHWEWPIKCEGHRRGQVMGGGLAASTSYYTDEFARRAVRAMIEDAAPDYHEFLRSMSTENETNGRALAGHQESNSPAEDPGSKEYQKITQWIASVHRGFGHSSKASMLNALKRKGVRSMVLRVAQDFHCEACEEANNHRLTHPPVSLEAIPPKWKQIQAKFSLIVDENCKVRVTKLLYHIVGQDRHRNPVWADLENFYEGRWLPYFGKPQRVKVDPEGSWMSQQAAQHFDSDSIGYEPIPGQAHWHISLAEEAIQATKGTMDKLVAENPDMSTEEALARATVAGNSREDVRGHSPLQHALGRAPDLDGHFFESDFDELPCVEAQRVDKEYGENYMRMYAAEQEYPRQVYLRRLGRAENAKNQALKAVAPGMWVRYFCEEKGEVKGRFKGLARVLAAETSRPVDGDLGANATLHPGRAGPVVWLARAERIIKVDLCQIRAASAREIACAGLMAGKDTPWTVNTFMNQAMRQEYLDFSGHDPTEQDEELASWEGVPEPSPPAKKARHEEPPSETKSERNQIPVRKAIRKKAPPPGGVASIAKATQAVQAEDVMMEMAALVAKASLDARSFWARQGASLEISVELPLAGKPLKLAARHMSTYMAGQLKRGKREISERTLAPGEVKKFSVAKATEVNNRVMLSALESSPPGVTPPPEDVMRMRWILEWKMDETTSEKTPKARIVVLGYMDLEYEHQPTIAPTMTRTSGHLVLKAMAWLGFKGYKADVTGAFTQNREIKHDLFVMPVKELAVALGVPEGVAMRLRKAVYGLVEAAIEWFMTVSEALEEFGWTQMKMDPRVWVLHGQSHGQDTRFTKEALGQFTRSEVMGELIAAKGDLDIVAIAGPHVDDFLLGGKGTDPRWIEARKKIEERFKWKTWETDEFMQTGAPIRQLPDMSFKMDQSEYVESIEGAVVSPERKKNKDAPTTDNEEGQLRAILGAIGWRSEQSGPMHSADTSLLLSAMPSSTVQTLLGANRLVDRVQEGVDLPVVIHSHSNAQVIVPIEWSDSSKANRPDGKSTKGLVTGMDELFGVKLQWLEILGNQIDWRNPEGALSQLPAALVLDSKGPCDELQTTVCTFRGKEKRADVEAMTLKEGSTASNNWVPRVHGDAQLANSLTKRHEPGQLRMYYNSGHRWKLVYNAKYQSAKKRKAAGILPFESVPPGVLRREDAGDGATCAAA